MKQEQWRKVEDIFHAVLERPPDSRQTFLNEICGLDTSLRRQVELLVSKGEQAGNFLEVSALANIPTTLTAMESLLGRQVGPYQIVAPLGAGGMGEVYRAHDSKLSRDVAIKTLPHEFARDPERLSRLRREARMLASLNHPNIAAIYGLEKSEDADCLVMELVEGEMLCGPLPIQTALERAGQVAAALEAAHDKGVIHRDLKPANIKITPHGRVKILDFGLAKAIWGPEGTANLAQLATGTALESVAGQVVGTPGYMSPEQARGGRVDKRADVWAFGCLLYELLTGKRAFPGQTIQDTIAAVLEREPDWRALPAKTPAGIRDLLRQCLQKDAGRRLNNIADAHAAIAKALRGWNRWRVAAIGAALLAMLAVGFVLWLRGSPGLPERSEWVPLTKLPDPVSQPALSPDGRMLAFIRSGSTFFAVGQIYVKKLPDGDAVELTHDNLKKMSPAFSPEGDRIAYTVVDSQFNWDTWVVPVRGGEPQLLLHNAADLVWTSPGQVLFSQIKNSPHMGIVSSNESGTANHDIYLPPNDRGMAHRARVSPDGKWVLLSEIAGHGNWVPCRVVPMDGSSTGHEVGPSRGGCTFGAWSPNGKWVYLTSKAGGLYHIWRQRFPDGPPEQLTSGLTEEEGLAMAPEGHSFVTAVALQSSSVWVHDAKGEHQISRLEGNAAYPKFTSDGKKVCYRIVKEVPRFGTVTDPGELWVADLESGRSEPLVPGFQPRDYDISADGKQVVMQVDDPDGKSRLWLAPFDRKSEPRQIPDVEGQSPMFGRSGEILFRRTEGSSGYVYCVRSDGTGLHKALQQPVFALTGVSPDGRWIEAWSSVPGNKPSAVQVFPLDGGAPVVIGSNAWLQWSPRGDFVWISGGAISDGHTYIIPLRRGQTLPRIPEGGFRSEEEVSRLPGARRMNGGGEPSPDPNVYAFFKGTIQRNLYRIPIP